MLKTRGFGEREGVAGGGAPADGAFRSAAGADQAPGEGRYSLAGVFEDRAFDPEQPGSAGTLAPEAGDEGREAGLHHLLVVDDDDAVRHACCEIARQMRFIVHAADSVPEARSVLKAQPVDLLLLDLKLPGGGGLLLLDEIRALHPETVVVVMTAFATVSSAVEAMRIGAADYLTKPFALQELKLTLARAAQRRQYDVESRLLRERLRSQNGDGHIIGNSPEMEKLYRILSKVAFSTHPVLILGESGTGKELVARTIHFNGPNAKRPFVPVDCGSLVPTLIESELFGYVKGAFTGATRSKEGLLAAAEGGTVFLDEIGELPLDLQAKLLRALQEKEVRPVGATQAVPISARVLAATNRNLLEMVEQGKFRKDLYFRLNVVNLRIPPLRDRREDIPALAQHFLDRMQRETGRQHMFSDDALRLMTEFDWPGNVRELENAIERACALSSGPLLHMGDLPTQLQDFRMQMHQSQIDQRQRALTGRADDGVGTGGVNGAGGGSVTGSPARQNSGTDTSLTQMENGERIVSIAELEKQAILNTIRQLHGDKLMAAKLLQIGKTTLYRKLKEYGIAEGVENTH
jgi:two-component system response regulator HydG